MIEYISFFVFIFLFIYLVFNNAKLKMSNLKLLTKNLQLIMDNNILSQKLQEELVKQKDESIENSEGFLNFISQSRDWAFSYIENVQSVINKFINDVKPHIDHFDKVGEAMWTPHSDQMKNISNAFKELIAIVPDDYGKIDE